MDKAPEKQAAWLISELERMLVAKGYEVHSLSFGYHKQFGMECSGNVGSIVGRRFFFGSEEKQFRRLLVRLGLCPPGTQPEDMPNWVRPLIQRQLKVLTSRSQAYSVARQMLQDQLDIAGGELWTCMLLEGERKPMDDYLSTLYGIIENYPDVCIHRTMNLSIQAFANAARRLFRKYPEAIESGRLRIYSSVVSDVEFLLSRNAVLLAFPNKRQKPRSHAGEISFGIYCKDEDFAKNLIQWYQTFLVDYRFGLIRTEAELDATINELEEEKFQKRED